MIFMGSAKILCRDSMQQKQFSLNKREDTHALVQRFMSSEKTAYMDLMSAEHMTDMACLVKQCMRTTCN